MACLPFPVWPACRFGLKFPECCMHFTLHQFQVIHLLHHPHTYARTLHSHTLSLTHSFACYIRSLLSLHCPMDTDLLTNGPIPWTVFAGSRSLPSLSYSSRTLVKFIDLYNFVQQGTFIALGMILLQQSNALSPSLAHFGAALGQSFVSAGGHNVSASRYSLCHLTFFPLH